MRVSLFLGLIPFVALLAMAKTIAKANGPTDEQIKELTRTNLALPFVNPDIADKNNVGWVYPTIKTLQVPAKTGTCNFTVIMDVSRCSGLQTGQEPIAYPYDDYSMSMLHNHVKFESAASNGKLYAQKRVELSKCGFNGRFFLMNQSKDNIFATNQMSIRLVLEEGKATTWVTSNPDRDETGISQNRVAPLTFRYFADSTKADKDPIADDANMRGKAKSIKTTFKTTNNYMYLQWC